VSLLHDGTRDHTSSRKPQVTPHDVRRLLSAILAALVLPNIFNKGPIIGSYRDAEPCEHIPGYGHLFSCAVGYAGPSCICSG
jgi:hypothetical protein